MANTKTGENLDSQLLYAIFTPALQKGYAQFAIKKTAPRQMPGGLTPADLNYLEPASKLFHIPATLYSVGQFSFNQMENPPACMVTRRDKPKTLILGDSGGYQILKGKLDVQSDNEREKIFNWLEANTDFAMTLDVPTAFAEDYGQFKECLTATKKHSKYWKKRYPTGQGQGNFLPVLQGGEEAWINEWDDFVSDDKYSGWAIAGKKKKNLYVVLKRLLKLIDQNKLGDKLFWVHFLGVSDLTTACMLTAMRNEFRELLGDNGFHISLDASNPFLLAGGFGQVYTGYKIKRSGLVMPTAKLEARLKNVGSDEPFPYADQSPIGKHLTMGDLVFKRPKNKDRKYGLDTTALHMITNHNVYVHVKGVIEANKKFAMKEEQAQRYFPQTMLSAKSAMAEIIRHEQPFDCLEKHKDLLIRASKAS